MLNWQMVRMGWAVPLQIVPNVRYAETLATASGKHRPIERDSGRSEDSTASRRSTVGTNVETCAKYLRASVELMTSSTDRQPARRPSINSIVQSLLGSRDGLVPGIQAFPNLDVDRIARDLSLDEKGERNGAANIPGPNDRTPDAAELDIRVAIERFVLGAQSSYEQQRDLYEERAQRATLSEGHQVAIEAAGENTLSTLRVYGHR